MRAVTRLASTGCGLAVLMLLSPASQGRRFTPWPQPHLAYEVRLDSAHPELIQVALRVAGAPDHLRLAMRVHPEYDARFWRYLTFDSITGTTPDSHAAIARLDTTLWQATLPGGRGEIHYTLHLPPAALGPRRSWQCVVRADGALLNPPDVFLYPPDAPSVPIQITFIAPRSWRIATSLERIATTRGSERLRAANAAELLDAPILAGRFREWSFHERGKPFVVDYWPSPHATPFDTSAFVDGLHGLVRVALDIFGGLRQASYHFLIQDDAHDALEHRASLTIGVPSADLAANPHSHTLEIAHEFFHTWNLVAIHPDTYGELTYRHTAPTSGLWVGEGLTMYYADLLSRRAGLVDTAKDSRARHTVDLLSTYLGEPWLGRVSPVAASLAFQHTLLDDPNATGGYYLQGQLLGEVLDAALRDSTDDRGTLDGVFRALYARSADGHGYSERGFERVVDSVCGCRLDRLFARSVRGAASIDLAPAMRRLGWRIVVDTVRATDDHGVPIPDLRVGVAPVDSTLALVLTNPASVWARAGLRTGDMVLSINGAHPRTFTDWYYAVHGLRVGNRVTLDLARADARLQVELTLPGYRRPSARLVDEDQVTSGQRARRARWLTGW